MSTATTLHFLPRAPRSPEEDLRLPDREGFAENLHRYVCHLSPGPQSVSQSAYSHSFCDVKSVCLRHTVEPQRQPHQLRFGTFAAASPSTRQTSCAATCLLDLSESFSKTHGCSGNMSGMCGKHRPGVIPVSPVGLFLRGR